MDKLTEYDAITYKLVEDTILIDEEDIQAAVNALRDLIKRVREVDTKYNALETMARMNAEGRAAAEAENAKLRERVKRLLHDELTHDSLMEAVEATASSLNNGGFDEFSAALMLHRCRKVVRAALSDNEKTDV